MINKNAIPINWKIIKISEVGNLLRGINYKKQDATNYAGDNYAPILRANNINVELNYNDLVYVPKKYIHEDQFIKTGDIVFAMSSGSKHLVGKSAKARSNFNGSFGAFCAVFRSFENINKDFIAYFFQSPYYKQLISEISKGTNINNLKREHILDLDFPLPPLSEQQQIVSKIEELFSELDKGKQQLETVRQQLKTYRQAVLKWAFEGRFTNKNIKDGQLTEEWKWVKFSEVVKDFIRGPFGSSLKKEFFTPRGYKVYEQQNAIYQSIELGRYFVSDKKFQELRRFEVLPNDYIVSCSGTIGKLFRIPDNAPKGLINQALLIIRINRDILLDKYFYYQFTSQSFQKLIIKDAKGTAMLNLAGVKDMKEVPILLPPIVDQIIIVQEIETRLSVCDKMEETIENSLQQVESLRQSILKQAFEGKLV
jgi:type I restriction enzyme S subunit